MPDQFSNFLEGAQKDYSKKSFTRYAGRNPDSSKQMTALAPVRNLRPGELGSAVNRRHAFQATRFPEHNDQRRKEVPDVPSDTVQRATPWMPDTVGLMEQTHQPGDNKEVNHRLSSATTRFHRRERVAFGRSGTHDQETGATMKSHSSDQARAHNTVLVSNPLQSVVVGQSSERSRVEGNRHGRQVNALHQKADSGLVDPAVARPAFMRCRDRTFHVGPSSSSGVDYTSTQRLTVSTMKRGTSAPLLPIKNVDGLSQTRQNPLVHGCRRTDVAPGRMGAMDAIVGRDQAAKSLRQAAHNGDGVVNRLVQVKQTDLARSTSATVLGRRAPKDLVARNTNASGRFDASLSRPPEVANEKDTTVTNTPMKATGQDGLGLKRTFDAHD